MTLACIGGLTATSSALAASPMEAPQLTVENVKANEATLHVTLDAAAPEPLAEAGTYQFIYRATASKACRGSGEKLAPSSPGMEFGNPGEAYSEPVTGLTAGTEYAVCVVQENDAKTEKMESAVTFTTATPAEKPVTKAAEDETATTAKLNGELNPGGSPTTKAGWYFTYGDEGTCTGAGETAHEGELEGKAVAVPATEITNLQPNKAYKVCLVATNSAGEAVPGNEVPFETLALPPTILSESAPAPKATEATLNAQINPNNQSTKYTFEYATNEALTENIASKAGAAPLTGFNSAGEPASVTLTGLTSQKLYYYRATAENAKGEKATPGPIQTFLTGPPETPVEAKLKAHSTTATTVEVEGTLNPNKAGEPGSTYEFLYNAGSNCEGAGGKALPAGQAQGLVKEHVTAKIAGLQANAQYTFCLIATNAAGEKTGAAGNEVTFSTHAAEPVVVAESEKAEQVTETTATIKAKVNPEGLDTHVYLEYGAGQVTAPQDIGPVVGEQEVKFGLEGLKAGATYPFHVIAFNDDGNVPGPGAEFKTIKTPLPNAEAPWWHLNAGARPTWIPAGFGNDQVQEIVTSAAVAFRVEVGGHFIGGTKYHQEFYATEPLASENGWKVLSAESLQEGFEEADAYGAGNVKVEENNEGLPSGEKRFLIITANSKTIDDIEEEAGTAEYKTKTAGKPSGTIDVVAANLGDAPADLETNPVTITDKLPHGVTATEYEAVTEGASAPEKGTNQVECELSTPGAPETVTCTVGGPGKAIEQLNPYGVVEIRIGVYVADGTASGQDNDVAVSGGGAAKAVSIERPLTIVKSPEEKASFGFETYELTAEEPGGVPDTQAGSHPFQTTFTIGLNQGPEFGNGGEVLTEPSGGLAKNVRTKLPPGLIGNPTPFPRCTLPEFQEGSCPADTQIGFTNLLVNEPAELGLKITLSAPLYNLEPSVGEPARFGFLPTKETPVFINTEVLSGEDYAIVGESANTIQVIGFLRAQITLWGVPGDSRHDGTRGRSLNQTKPPPFLAMPTSCTGNALESVAEANSWSDPEKYVPASTSDSSVSEQPMQTLDGCDKLPFEPSIKVTPDDTNASSPTGLDVDVHVPQEGQLNANSLAQSALRATTVALPPGFALNPAASDGLEACTGNPAALSPHTFGTPGDEAGFEGFREFDPVTEPGVSEPAFTPYLPGNLAAIGEAESGISPASEMTRTPGQNFCPDASKIGEVTIKTPLLPNPLTGFVYLATQEANPFDSLIAMYVIVEDKVSGSVVKLPGEVQLCKGAGEVIAGQTCEALGQIVTTFENTPQLAFEDFEAHFYGGERAPLASPVRCGSYTTKAAFAPWAGEENHTTHEINPDEIVHTSSTYSVNQGPKTLSEPNGSPCPGASLPFSPSLTGGALNVNAGAFSPFTLSLTRQPGEQNMQSVTATLPEGLSGLLSSVELCPEPRANNGECGPNSLIGEATVSVGVGGNPFTVRGGKFYVTGPYNGSGGCSTPGSNGCAPFGITFEVPAKAGPFDLAHTKNNSPACDCIVTRGKIEVNPETTALTITSNPPGTPDSIPTSIEGIPLEIQHINATTTRSAFQFNPTNCNKMEVTGTIHSSEGGSDSIGVPFQVTNCASLKFEPKFSVGTSGKTSKALGASLTAKVTYPNVPQGTDADITKVKVELPKQLPSRLTTLQKACTDAQFNANPAGCPSASKIGYAVVHTPLLPVPLEGPAIFVSHGGEAFPSLTMVLQGYGVTIDLVGTTFISKSGVTSTTFKTVPDDPFSSFTLTLPEGKYSALAANGNLCTDASKLTMPTEFIAQNGMAIHETTKIGVSGCAKTKTRAQKLAAALKVCHRDKNKGKRAKCEKAAKKKYGPLKKAKKPAKKKG